MGDSSRSGHDPAVAARRGASSCSPARSTRRPARSRCGPCPAGSAPRTRRTSRGRHRRRRRRRDRRHQRPHAGVARPRRWESRRPRCPRSTPTARAWVSDDAARGRRRRGRRRSPRPSRRGDAALRALAPDETPILWPEHFDIGITVGEVNYGVSAGDGYLAVPYAYVGPWSPPAQDDFWNAPFGRALPVDEIDDLLAFFTEGRDRLG